MPASTPYGTVNISGLMVQGNTLTATSSIVDPSGLYKNVTYKWLSTVDGITWSTIGTGSNFTLTAAQNYTQIEAIATYTNGLGATTDIKSTPTFSVLPYAVTKSVSNGVVSAGITGGGISFNVSLLQLGSGDLIGFGSLNDSNAPGGASTYGNYTKLLVTDFYSNGVLNSKFGNQGFGLWDFGGGYNFAENFYQQADGKFVITGSVGTYSNPQFGIARYNSDGTLDSTFGTNGETVTSFSSIYGGFCYASNRQSDGKYILVGRVTSPQNYGEAATVRFNSDGTIDRTFGSNGTVITDVGSNLSMTFSMQQSDGKILEVGSLQVGSGTTFKGYTEILRYNTNGTLDTTFGNNGNGIVKSNYSGYFDQGFSALQQSNGKLIVLSSGYGNGNSSACVYLSRYNLDGFLDTTFGNAGVLTISNTALSGSLTNSTLGGCQLIQQFDGKLVLAVGESVYPGGTSSTYLSMVRLNSDGAYDNTFGIGGKVFINTAGSYFPSSIIQESNGQIVVAGSGSSGSSGYINLLRVNLDGSLDSSFGSFVNHSPTGTVTISGTATQGRTLTASNTLIDADGLGTIAYSWKANGIAIGSGATYTLTEAEVGKSITATASYIDLLGTAESVLSGATSSVSNLINLNLSPASVNESGSTNLTYTFTRTGSISTSQTINFGVTGTASYTDYTSSVDNTSGPKKSWTKLLGTSADDRARILTAGADGAIYVTGYTTGNLDGQTNNGNQDVFITKYLADGTKSWTKLLGTSGDEDVASITAGVDGALYIAGYTYGNLDGQTNNGFDAFITKYLSDGTKSWTKLLGSSSFDGANSLTTGLDGAIYVSGYTSGNLDGQTNKGSSDGFIAKYLPDGTKSWTKLIGTNVTDAVSALATGVDGSIYVSGYTYGNLDGQTNNGNQDVFITKYLPDGTKSWTKLLGTILDDYALGLSIGLDGAIYLSGFTKGNLDGQTNSGIFDAFVTTFLQDGTKSWTKLIGTSSDDGAYGITTGLDGAIYVSGYTSGNLDGQTNSGINDGFITKYFVLPQITFSAGSSTATLVIDPTPDSIVEGNETVVVSIVPGSGYDLGSGSTATGTIADTIRFLGSFSNDTFVGNQVTDTRNNFVGGGGNDDITGNSRADVAEYSANLSYYNISASNGLITISDSRLGISYDGTDTLHGINLLKFADGMEFVGLAAQRVALTGSEVNHTVQVTESKLYSGTNAAEKFVIGSNVSSMILAGEGDTVHLAGSFTDYTYSSRGSELQITNGDFMTTVNLAGNVSIETDLGHVNAKLDFTQATPRVMLDTQLVTMGSIDATLLNTHAVL